MAKNSKGVPPIKDDSLESGGWSPQVPGVKESFVVPEAGHEGARAAYELCYFMGGQITKDEKPMFRDYDDALRISEDV